MGHSTAPDPSGGDGEGELARLRGSVSKERLAHELGVSTRTVYAWEHAKRPKPFQRYAYEVALERLTMIDRSRSWADLMGGEQLELALAS